MFRTLFSDICIVWFNLLVPKKNPIIYTRRQCPKHVSNQVRRQIVYVSVRACVYARV